MLDAAQVGTTLNAYNIYPTYSLIPNGWLTNGNPSQKNYNIRAVFHEIGTEFRLFNNRLWGDFQRYYTQDKDQIIS